MMKRLAMVLMVALIMLPAVAAPAMAKGAKKSARQTPPPADGGQAKATPKTGGMPVGSVALLGGGGLLVGGGLVAARLARRRYY